MGHIACQSRDTVQARLSYFSQSSRRLPPSFRRRVLRRTRRDSASPPRFTIRRAAAAALRRCAVRLEKACRRLSPYAQVPSL